MYRINRGISIQHASIFSPRMLPLPDGTLVPIPEYDERLALYEAAQAAKEEDSGKAEEGPHPLA